MRLTERRQKFSQKKSLGQVFLREDWPCQKMVEKLKMHNVKYVIEVGPGLGVLTRFLLEAGMHITAVEKDSRLIERLNELASSTSYSGSLKIVNQDILKFDIVKWLDDHKHNGRALCGNIPYNISSPLLVWLLPHLSELRISTLMVQLEFAERVTSLPNSKSYGSVSVFTQLRAKSHLDFKVSRTCFHPVPKVDSAVMTLTPLKEKLPEKILRKVEDITRKAFTQRRKKLKNSLSFCIKDDAEDLQRIPIDLNRRCDSVSPMEFVKIAQSIKDDVTESI